MSDAEVEVIAVTLLDLLDEATATPPFPPGVDLISSQMRSFLNRVQRDRSTAYRSEVDEIVAAGREIGAWRRRELGRDPYNKRRIAIIKDLLRLREELPEPPAVEMAIRHDRPSLPPAPSTTVPGFPNLYDAEEEQIWTFLQPYDHGHGPVSVAELRVLLEDSLASVSTESHNPPEWRRGAAYGFGVLHRAIAAPETVTLADVFGMARWLTRMESERIDMVGQDNNKEMRERWFQILARLAVDSCQHGSADESSRAGHLIRERREARGLTQHDLARLVDVSERTIRRWEEDAEPSLRHRSRLAEILGGRPTDYRSSDASADGAGPTG